ncbi:hypothetical protein P280DRAFT_47786 [Massarina eburnea CBS 473.64]|uniref:Uncharacterized protein n=1 Tax=Massarina eburnea CBS 473.64 TaxID=1395130 RepID=A0A6A6RW29_9PLEO|nr:hypothetical protein P280DRAFT_47786 [Massarina eburnea CBS 473.64]
MQKLTVFLSADPHSACYCRGADKMRRKFPRLVSVRPPSYLYNTYRGPRGRIDGPASVLLAGCMHTSSSPPRCRPPAPGLAVNNTDMRRLRKRALFSRKARRLPSAGTSVEHMEQSGPPPRHVTAAAGRLFKFLLRCTLLHSSSTTRGAAPRLQVLQVLQYSPRLTHRNAPRPVSIGRQHISPAQHRSRKLSSERAQLAPVSA